MKTNPTNHRVLKRWEIENYLFDKEVLMKYCQEENLEFKEEAYERHFTNVIDDNLKDEIGKVKNCCSIINSINPEVFKEGLASIITEDMQVYKELESCIFSRS